MENLKLLRKQAKLTQMDMAKKFNLSLRGYQAIENDINETSYGNIKKFADFFNCSIDYLLGYKINETPIQQTIISAVRTLDEDLCELANAYIQGLIATQKQRDMVRARVSQQNNNIEEDID